MLTFPFLESFFFDFPNFFFNLAIFLSILANFLSFDFESVLAVLDDCLAFSQGATVDTLIVVFAPAFFTISQILQSSSSTLG